MSKQLTRPEWYEPVGKAFVVKGDEVGNAQGWMSNRLKDGDVIVCMGANGEYTYYWLILHYGTNFCEAIEGSMFVGGGFRHYLLTFNAIEWAHFGEYQILKTCHLNKTGNWNRLITQRIRKIEQQLALEEAEAARKWEEWTAEFNREHGLTGELPASDTTSITPTLVTTLHRP